MKLLKPKSTTITLFRILCLAGLLLALPSVAKGNPYRFTKLADGATAAPDGYGSLVNFYAPAIDGSTVAFESSSSYNNNYGIYMFRSGTLSPMVKEDTSPVPGMPGFWFNSLNGEISLEGTMVAFQAEISDGVDWYEGVFTASGDTITKIADTNSTLMPGTGSVFDFVWEPALSAGKVAFKGRDSVSFYGIYSDVNTGTLQMVADENTPVPGRPPGSIFTDFDNEVSLDGTTIAFWGRFDFNDPCGLTSEVGVFTASDGNIITIADIIDTNVPDGNGVFSSLGPPSIDGDYVVFWGSDANNDEGIYTNLGGTLRMVADENTPIPGAAGTFTGFQGDDCTIDGNSILFYGQGGGAFKGVYIEMDGQLYKVIDSNDTLDGKELDSLAVGFDRALSGSEIALYAGFDDGSEGIYVSTLLANILVYKTATKGTEFDLGTGEMEKVKRRGYLVVDVNLVDLFVNAAQLVSYGKDGSKWQETERVDLQFNLLQSGNGEMIIAQYSSNGTNATLISKAKDTKIGTVDKELVPNNMKGSVLFTTADATGSGIMKAKLNGSWTKEANEGVKLIEDVVAEIEAALADKGYTP